MVSLELADMYLRSNLSMSSKGRHCPDGGSALGAMRLYSFIASCRVNSLIGFSDIGGISAPCPRVKSAGGGCGSPTTCLV
jgi:hypothetical protein